MAARRPRGGGYYNAAVGVAGVSVQLPAGAAGYTIHVGAACFIRTGNDATLGTPSTANGWGAMGAGQWEEFSSQGGVTTERYIHVAAISGTAAVSIAFL